MHKIPTDLQKAITANQEALKTWEIVTPLARNEWICWVTSGKKVECVDPVAGKAAPIEILQRRYNIFCEKVSGLNLLCPFIPISFNAYYAK